MKRYIKWSRWWIIALLLCLFGQGVVQAQNFIQSPSTAYATRAANGTVTASVGLYSTGRYQFMDLYYIDIVDYGEPRVTSYSLRLISSNSSYTTYEIDLTFAPYTFTGDRTVEYEIAHTYGSSYVQVHIPGAPSSVNAGTITPSSQRIRNDDPIQNLVHTGYSGVTSRVWQISYNGGSSWTTTSATGTTYSPSAMNNGDTPVTLYYRISVNNGAYFTPAASVTVDPLQVGSISPTSQSITSGAAPQTLTHSGHSVINTRQWQYSTNSGSTWNNTGVSSSTFTPYNTNTGSSAITYLYRVLINGNTSKVTPTVSVRVDPVTFNVGYVSPSSQSVYSGNSASMAYGNYSNVGTWEWQRSTNGSSWSSVGNNNQTNYSPTQTNSGSTDIVYYYRVMTANAGATSAVSVTIKPESAGSISPSSQSVALNGTPQALWHTGYSGSPTRQWQKSTDGSTWENIGVTEDNYTPPTDVAGTTYYQVLVNGNKYSSRATVTVAQALVLGTITPDQTIIKGDNAAPISLSSVSGGTGSYSYNWQRRVPNGSWTNAGSYSASYSPGAVNATTEFQVIVTSGSQSKTSGTHRVTMLPMAIDHLEFSSFTETQAVSYLGGDYKGVYTTSDVNDVGFIGYAIAELYRREYGVNFYVEAVATGTNTGILTISVPQNFYPTAQSYPLSVGSGSISIYQNSIPGFLYAFYAGGGGNIPASITLSNSQPGGVVYKLMKDGTEVRRMTGTGSAITFTDIVESGTYQIRASYGSSEILMNGSVIVNPANTGVINPATYTITSYDEAPRLRHSSASGMTVNTYQWMKKEGNGDWEPINGATTNEYSPGVLSHSETSAQVVHFRVQLNGLNLYSAESAITVNPLTGGVITPASQTIELGETAARLRNEGSFGVTFRQWLKSTDRVTWSPVGTNIDYLDPGSPPQTTYYKVRINNKEIYSSEAVVTVRLGNEVALTPSENFIAKHVFRQPMTSVPEQIDTAVAISSVTYFDGLGRAKLQVEIGASPNGKDLVTPIEYDLVGHADAKQYLPYEAATGTGAYRPTAFTNQVDFYTALFGANDADRAFVERSYERSPLDRVLWQQNVGKEYSVAGKKATFGYGANTTNDQVLLLTVSGDNLVATGHYVPGKLYKSTSTNEDGLIAHTFTDLLGRTVLERSTDGTTTMDTYYVYDDLSRLRFVLSPEGSALLPTTGIGTWNRSSNPVKLYGYAYTYDTRGNVIEKQLPGADPVYYVYDQLDRVVATQDGNGRATSGSNYWLMTRYDAHGRPVEMFMLSGARTRSEVQANYDSLYSQGVLQAQYVYDSYPSAASSLSEGTVAELTFDFDKSQMRGMKTYEKLAVLGGSGFVEKVFYYDDKGRPVQTVEKNHLGYTSRYSKQYDFLGNVLKAHESHGVTATQTNTTLQTYAYDHRNRAQGITAQLDNSPVAQVTYTYTPLGQLQAKTYGMGANAFTSTRAYNIQGWQTTQSSLFFISTLGYFNAGTASSYTGNITRWSWTNASNSIYNYVYDTFGRLTSGTAGAAGYEGGITYDRNGNIKSLTRRGNPEDNGTFTYTYDGNQLKTLGGWTFRYDANGNMTEDPKRNLFFSYNFLNLVDVVKRRSSDVSLYKYDASGRKVQVRSGTAPTATGFDYLGSVTYTKGTYASSFTPEVAFGEGMIKGTEVAYFETDHLGSVRTIVNQYGSVLEQNDYLPFGIRINTGRTYANNRKKFNGKEVQTMGGFDHLLDYGARMHDPGRGRWFTMDPLAEMNYSVSPYAFSGNNPVRYIDSDGRMYGDYYDWEGNYLGNDGIDDNLVYRLKSSYSANFENSKVNWGGTLVKEDYLALQGVSDNLGTTQEAFVTGDLVSDTRILGLHPAIRMKATNFMIEANVKSPDALIRISQGYRSYAEQDGLYAQGRTLPGSIVTNAKGGESVHNFGLAFDIVSIVNGKANYDLDWNSISALGKSHGFDWGGDWKTFKDKPHFESTFGNSLKELRALPKGQNNLPILKK